ncbi:MAG: orotidine 5'-phosphate decarboxylase [Verrucomicrobiales bacterium]|nr:orotidine 5'-phosphate decarboxylase [Verrucomicrobiales bacterium]
MQKVPMKPIVQISLDLTNIEEALETAEMALRAGVDWLEAGTPLILAEGLHGVRALHERFPDTPIVADLKTMDGGYLEAEMMAKADASHVVVMSQAHEETIKCVVQAGADFGVGVMGDNLASQDMVAGAKRLEDLGCGLDHQSRLGAKPLNFSLDPLIQKNVTLQGSFSHNWPIWERVLALLSSGKLDVAPIIGGTWAIADWHTAFEKMHHGEVIKSVLTP